LYTNDEFVLRTNSFRGRGIIRVRPTEFNSDYISTRGGRSHLKSHSDVARVITHILEYSCFEYPRKPDHILYKALIDCSKLMQFFAVTFPMIRETKAPILKELGLKSWCMTKTENGMPIPRHMEVIVDAMKKVGLRRHKMLMKEAAKKAKETLVEKKEESEEYLDLLKDPQCPAHVFNQVVYKLDNNPKRFTNELVRYFLLNPNIPRDIYLDYLNNPKRLNSLKSDVLCLQNPAMSLLLLEDPGKFVVTQDKTQ
jgi:hypothetical protein